MKVQSMPIKDSLREEECAETGVYYGNQIHHESKENSSYYQWKRKSRHCKRSIFGPVTPKVPASILQLHNDVILVADADALSEVEDLL